MRANPPGKVASDPARAGLFSAALEQSQQFMEAAASVGYATRPVQLFYGVSQLGRSVAAASWRLPDTVSADQRPGRHRGARESEEAWRLSGHGITTPRLRQCSRSGLRSIVVKGQPRGSLPGVARAIGSPSLPADREVPVTDLWAMLPEARQAPLTDFAEKPVILACGFGSDQKWYDAAGIPDGPAMTHVKLRGIPGDLCEASLDDFLTWYPGLSVPRPPDEMVAGRRWDRKLTWVANQDDVQKGWADGCDHGVSVDLPTVTYRGSECTVPVISGMREPVHPLIVWWSVLFALSMLARYEPDTWWTLIDVDHSTEANAVEHLLDIALDIVPEIILDVLEDMSEADN